MKKLGVIMLLLLAGATASAQDAAAAAESAEWAAESAEAAAESAAAAEAAAAEAAQTVAAARDEAVRAVTQAARANQVGGDTSLSLGPEANMNARNNIAGGLGICFEFGLSNFLALGVGFAASYNFVDITVLEPSIFLRSYILANKVTGLFIQMEEGVNIIMEDDEVLVRFLTGLCVGYRIAVGPQFYVEPCGRIGWPYVFGLGATAGIRF